MNIEDRAQAHEAQEWEIRNLAREVTRFEPGALGYGPATCTDCDAPMHPVRRGYGFKICTPCASGLEPKPGFRR